ncbi:unnamed protein product [Cochlearia groenlandica]
MARYYTEELVVPTYQETSDSYPSPHVMWDDWNINSQKTAEKCFDFDFTNNGFTEEEEAKRLKKDNDCFFNSVSSLHEFDGIQHMDDIFLNSILEDVPGNVNINSFNDSDNIDTINGVGEVPMFHYMTPMVRNESYDICISILYYTIMKNSDICEDNMEEEPSTEEVVLQNLQKATEKLTDDTRKCFRDTFYRLAKNSQHNFGSDNNNNNNNLEEFLDDETRSKDQKTELETNSIDRAVANLTFNHMESNLRNMPSPNRPSSHLQG